MNTDEKRFLRLASILHDIGHGPFSHVSEEAIIEIANSTSHSIIPSDVHETIAIHLIQNDKHISYHLSDYDKQQITDILNARYPNNIVAQAISGPIDADKQDYLLRDAYYCGVQYGQYDIDRLHHTIRSCPDTPGTGKSHLGIREGGIEATEQFLQARYYMHAQVYSHEVRRCTDLMLVRAILLAVTHDCLPPIIDAFTFEDTASFAFRFSEWDDEKLLQYAESLTNSRTKFSRLIKRLRDRRLFKRIFHRHIDQISSVYQATRDALVSTIHISSKRRVESAIASELGIDPDDVIFSTQSLEWGIKRSGSTDEGSLLVLHDDTKPTLFSEESLIFHSISESLRRVSISVYAPTEALADRNASPQARASMRDNIANTIDSVLGETNLSQEVACH